MGTATAKVPEGYRVDARGALIPEANIRDIDIKRDELVCELINEAKERAGGLADFRTRAREAIEDFVDESAKALRAKKLGGVKGNVQLMSFDGRYKVQSATADRIVFDERLSVAKELIDRCLKSWSAGANGNLVAVVNQAFDVDKEGNVSSKRILGLKTLKIDDATWRKAMEAISQAVQVVSTKNYVRFYERNENGEYRQISLNIAAD